MKPFIDHILPQSINIIDLSERQAFALRLLNVCNIEDIYTITKSDLINIRGFGRTSLWDLMDKLAEYGIKIPN